jgi:hypothetical protein
LIPRHNLPVAGEIAKGRVRVAADYLVNTAD